MTGSLKAYLIGGLVCGAAAGLAVFGAEERAKGRLSAELAATHAHEHQLDSTLALQKDSTRQFKAAQEAAHLVVVQKDMALALHERALAGVQADFDLLRSVVWSPADSAAGVPKPAIIVAADTLNQENAATLRSCKDDVTAAKNETSACDRRAASLERQISTYDAKLLVKDTLRMKEVAHAKAGRWTERGLSLAAVIAAYFAGRR